MSTITRSSKILIGLGTFGITLPFLYKAIQPLYKNLKPCENRTAIVTGATGNLGSLISYRLALNKVRVIMACRDLEACKSIRREIVYLTQHKGIVCRHLDLEDIDSINKFADDMIKNEPHIDILINNAAVKDVKQKELTKYGIEKNYFVNFLGPYLLTLRLLDKLKESASITRDSRIVNVIGTPKRSWKVNYKDINFDKTSYSSKKAYNQSKMALAYFTILLNELNKEEKNFVLVFGSSPIYSNITKSFYKPKTLWEQFESFIQYYTAVHPLNAISTTINCAIDPGLDRDKSGKLYTYFLRSFGWGAADKDKNLAKLVWNMAAETLLNIKEETIKPEFVQETSSTEKLPDNLNMETKVGQHSS